MCITACSQTYILGQCVSTADCHETLIGWHQLSWSISIWLLARIRLWNYFGHPYKWTTVEGTCGKCDLAHSSVPLSGFQDHQSQYSFDCQGRGVGSLCFKCSFLLGCTFPEGCASGLLCCAMPVMHWCATRFYFFPTCHLRYPVSQTSEILWGSGLSDSGMAM